MTADDLAKQGARASAAMVSTWWNFFRNMLFSAIAGYIVDSKDPFAHILQGYFTGTKHQTTTKQSKAWIICIIHGEKWTGINT